MNEPRQGRGTARAFARLPLAIGAVLLALGVHGMAMGARTLAWPRTEAQILDARVDLRLSTSPTPFTDKYRGGRSETRETASFRVRYRYTVKATQYEGSGVEPTDFGLQNSAAARDMGRRYPPGRRVAVAYHPSNPAVSYLEPGPSSVAWVLSGLGGGLVALGLWMRQRHGRRIGSD